MSEHRELYRYAVDREVAMQQRNMTNGVFDMVRPHLEIAGQALERTTPDFLAALQAFLTDPSDPTGLRLYNLREAARDLSRNFTVVSSLLAQIAGEQDKSS